MKLFVLEYEGSYTGGSKVVIAKDVKELCTKIKNVITDKRECQIRKLLNLPFKVNGYPRQKFLKLVESFDTIKDEILPIISNPKLSNYPGYSNGNIRPDWFTNFTMKDGLYLVYENESSEKEFKIISDTYHSG